MTVPSKPSPNQDAAPFLASATMWSLIIDMLTEWRSGKFTQQPQRPGGKKTAPRVKRNDTNLRAAMVIQQVDSVEDPALGTSDTELLRQASKNLILKVKDPVWHTAIDNLVIPKSPIRNDVLSTVYSSRYAVLPVSGTASGRGYAMIDPTTTTTLKASTSGIYKIVTTLSDANSTSIVDLWQSQPLWKYELTQDSQAPSDTTAKLLMLDNTQFAASINLSDPDSLMSDQVSGDKGWCIHCGNKFYAIQAVCV